MTFVENLGENPEMVSVGSNPHFDPRNVAAHVALPSSNRPKFMDEVISTVHVNELETCFLN